MGLATPTFLSGSSVQVLMLADFSKAERQLIRRLLSGKALQNPS